ncbi:MFS-type transporter SLC18B1-like isoform X2 [Gigantopelta aegis]|uniref:MFS-type transporter SLC18B1-like isoform X2 n=1 Tax=Gigantopelta aegis TaxID=1735272 RepID=UPI001B88B873|nr:MFS-type transporter SLC18B1-like isoform X2 [Gigantopelta aegis]
MEFSTGVTLRSVMETERSACVPSKASENGPNRNKKTLEWRDFSRWKILLLLILCLANFLAGSCFSLMGPFFPREAAMKGTSPLVIGLIFGCYQFVTFVTSPIFGSLISTIGANFLHVSGLFLGGSCTILFGLLDQSQSGIPFITLSFVTRSVEALGSAAFMTSSRAIASTAFPDNVATVYGVLNTFTGLGYMAGLPLGSVLYQFGGFGLPFWSIGTAMLICVVFSFGFMPSTICSDDATQKYSGSVFGLYRSPSVCISSWCIFCVALELAVVLTTYSIYLEKTFGLSPISIGALYFTKPLTYTISAPVFGWIVDTKSGYCRRLMAAVPFVFAITLLMWGPSPLLKPLRPTIWMNCASGVVSGVSLGCLYMSSIACILCAAKEMGYADNLDTHGLVSGCYVMSTGLGSCVGSVFGGVMMQYAGFEWSLTVVAGLFVTCRTTAFDYDIWLQVRL